MPGCALQRDMPRRLLIAASKRSGLHKMQMFDYGKQFLQSHSLYPSTPPPFRAAIYLLFVCVVDIYSGPLVHVLLDEWNSSVEGNAPLVLY